MWPDLPVRRIRTDQGTECCGRIDAVQADLDEWLRHDNTEPPHQGAMCCAKTPFRSMSEGKEILKGKFVN